MGISFGNAWGGNLGFSADRASENYRQVIEQSGLFAEAGGYHVNANQVHLTGGAIASTNGENSELATNQLTVEHIQNHSSSQAMSGGASFGMSHKEGHFEEKGTGKVVKNPETSNLDTNNLKWVNESTSPSLNTGIPMYDSHHDNSVTKATITAGKITLNKDSQPIHTTVEALAKTLNINTALDEANQQVEKAKDTQLQEQKILREAVGNLQSAMATYTANQAKSAELEAERLEQDIAREQDTQKLQQKTTALLNARDTQKQWSDGGSYKRTLDTATTIASGLLAGQSSTQIATPLASPYLNQQIKRFTTDEKGEVNLLTNTLAHAILGAAEAAANNGNITAGAISASASELAAPVITKAFGKTNANQLNSDERQTVTTLSSLVGALTAGLTAQQTGSANNTVGILNAAALGGEIGKRAVENNNFGTVFTTSPADLQAIAEGSVAKESIEQGVQKYMKKEHPAIYRTAEGAYYVLSKTGKAIYISRELVLQVAPMLLAPEIAAGTKVYGVLSQAAISGGANFAVQKISGQEFNFYEFAGAVVSGSASPLFKTTADAIRFNAGVGMATGIANGGDGLKEGGLAAGATYGVAKVSKPILSIFLGETIQKSPVIIQNIINNKENELNE